MRGLAEAGAVWGPLKRQKQLEIHPPEKILECAKREWDEWRKSLNKMGYENTPDSWRYFSQFFPQQKQGGISRWNFTCWYFLKDRCMVSVAIVGTSRVRR